MPARRGLARKNTPKENESPWRRALGDNVKSYALLIAVLVFVRSVVVQATVVPSSSMENTILVGDHLFLDKIMYGPRIPFTPFRLPALKDTQRGDVIAFRSPSVAASGVWRSPARRLEHPHTFSHPHPVVSHGKYHAQ